MDAEATGLATVAGRYYALRGLLLVPTGLLFVAAGVFNMPPIGDEKVSGTWPFFLAAVVVAVVGYVAFNHYYVTKFGHVEPSTATKVRMVVFTVFGAALICAGITVDMQVHPPINAYGLSFAVAMLAYYRLIASLQRYHWVLFGGLALLSVVPVWSHVDDPVSLVLIPMGLVTMAVGLFDHRDLVRSIRHVQDAAVVGGVDAHIA